MIVRQVSHVLSLNQGQFNREPLLNPDKSRDLPHLTTLPQLHSHVNLVAATRATTQVATAENPVNPHF